MDIGATLASKRETARGASEKENKANENEKGTTTSGTTVSRRQLAQYTHMLSMS